MTVVLTIHYAARMEFANRLRAIASRGHCCAHAAASPSDRSAVEGLAAAVALELAPSPGLSPQ